MYTLIIAVVTAAIILGSVILLVVPGVILSMRSKQRGTETSTTTIDRKSTPTAPATGVAPGKKDEAKKFKFVAFSWVSPYVYVATALLAPWFIPDTLSARDTVLLTVVVAIILSAVASTLVENFFDKTLEKKVYTVTMAALIAWFGLLLFQNNFSVTSSIKDAWKPLGEALDPLYQVLVGGRSTRTSVETTTSTAPLVPVGALPSVVVPACGNGWSNTISIPAFWNVTSAWSMETVQAAWRENGEWKQFEGKYLSGSFDAVKYCAKNRSYAGEEMLLTWTQR